jgi:hypothetical protein
LANQDFRVKNGLQVGLGASVVGIVTAESFSGSAVGLTSVPSASLTGTISSERLSGTYDIDILGTVSGETITATTATVTEQLNVGAGNTGVFATAADGTLSVTGIATFKDRVIFDSTNSIQIPVGTDAEKDAVGTAVTGQIRYNTTNSQFEGFGPGNDWGSLGGVKDVDGDTYVKPESSPGSDEDALTFFTAGTERVVIDSNGKVGIGTTNPTATLDLDGTQNVSGISTFQDRVIFDSTNSIQIPVGTSTERDAVGTAVTGQIRYNTTLSSFEGYGPGGEWGTLGGVKDIDQDTYITAQKDLSVDDDALRFYTNGTEQVSINSTGKVGIGSTQPTSTLDLDGTLNVSGISTFHDDVNIGIGGTVAFFDISAGKVGVGTLPSATSGKISLPTLTGFDGGALFSAGNQLSDYSLWVLNDSANANPNLRQKYVRQFTYNDYTISVGSSKAFRVSNPGSFNNNVNSAPGGMPDNEVAFVVNPDTSTELRYNYSKKLETTTDGFKVLNGTSETAVISGPQNIILDPSPDDVVAIVEGDISSAGVSTITGITTTNIAVGNLIQEVDGIISTGTTVTSVGVSQVGISKTSLGVATNQEFTFVNQTPTGIVRIKGDLYVDGTRTEINSTTLTVDDLNVVVASGATNGLTADTAGLTVDGANAYLKYNYNAGTNETWELNKNVAIGTDNARATLDVNGDVLLPNGSATLNFGLDIPNADLVIGHNGQFPNSGYIANLSGDLDYLSQKHIFSDEQEQWKYLELSDDESALYGSNTKKLSVSGIGVSITDDVSIGTGATVAFFDISSGNIGLGTNAPLQKFQIGAANTLGISTDGKVFIVTSDGSVGVGTTNPTAKLDVDGTLNVSGISTFLDNVNIGTAATTVDLPGLYLKGNSDTANFLQNPSISIGGTTNSKYYNTFLVDAPYVQYVRHWANGLDINFSVQDARQFVVSNTAGANSITPPGVSDNQIAFKIIPESSTELRYNKVKKLETTGYGVSVYGGANVSGVSTFQNGIHVDVGVTTDIALKIGGNTELNSLEFKYLSGTPGARILTLQAPNSGDITFLTSGNFDVWDLTGNKHSLRAAPNGSVELYYNGASSAKLRTRDYGIDVTGRVETDTLNVSGIVTARRFIGDGSQLRGIQSNQNTHHSASSNISDTSRSISGISTYTKVGIFTGDTVSENAGLSNVVKLSADGEIMILAQPGLLANPPEPNNGEGLVYFARRNASGTYTQVGIVTSGENENINENDEFGYSIAITPDAKTLVVGAAYAGVNTNGKAYVYDLEGDTYSQVSILTGVGTAYGTEFGSAVDISSNGKTIAISAQKGTAPGVSSENGVVYVFDRNSDDTFTQVGILTGYLTGPGDLNFVGSTYDAQKYGQNVQVVNNGNTVVVASQYQQSSPNGYSHGAVEIWDRDITTNQFSRIHRINYDPTTEPYLGGDLGTGLFCTDDGRIMVISDHTLSTNDGSVQTFGGFHVYERLGNTFTRKSITYGPEISSDFGRYSGIVASADASIVVIALTEYSDGVFVFEKVDGNYNYNLVAKYQGDEGGNVAYNQLGGSLAITADGKTIVACDNSGFANFPGTGVSGAGAVYIHEQQRQEYLSVVSSYKDGLISSGNSGLFLKLENHTPEAPIGLNEDIGENWEEIDTSFLSSSAGAWTTTYCGDGIVILGEEKGDLYRSTDYGLTWIKVHNATSLDGVFEIVYCGNGIVIAGVGNGADDGDVLRSTDYGVTWTQISLGSAYEVVYSLEYCGNGIVLAGMGSGSGDSDVYRSTDYGATWSFADSLEFLEAVHALKYCGNGIVIAGVRDDTPSNSNNGDIYRSTDYGANFRKVELNDTTIESIDSLEYCGGGIVLAGSGGNSSDADIWRSTDYGRTWTQINPTYFDSNGSVFGGLRHCGNGIVLAGLWDLTNNISRIYKSTDYGVTWTLVQTITNSDSVEIEYCGNGIVLAASAANIGKGELYRSEVGFSQAKTLQGVHHQTGTGNIGIGSAQPTAKLDINGTLNVSGISTFQDNINIASEKYIEQIAVGSVNDGPLRNIKGHNNNPVYFYREYAHSNTTGGTPTYYQWVDDGINYEIAVGHDSKFIIGDNNSRPISLSSNITSFEVDIDGATTLTHNKNKKLETTGYGVTVSGGLNVSGITTIGNYLNIGGSDISIGSTTINGDQAITFDGTAGNLFTLVDNLTTGNLFAVNDVSGFSVFEVDVDGTVRMGFAANDKVGIGSITPTAKLDVDGTLNVSGVSTFASDLDINGTLNVSGVSTFQDDINVGAGKSILWGGTDNFHITTSSGHGLVETNGELYFGTTHLYIQKPGGTTTMAEFIQDGAVKLNHNNSTKLQTHDYGIDVTGRVETDTLNVSGIATAQKFIGDGSELTNLPPAGSDLVTYASASNIANSAESISGISTYIQLDSLLSSQTAGAGRPWRFGRSNAMSADASTLIVGAPEGSLNGSSDNTGLVHVFDREGNSYREVGILTAGAYADNIDKFGHSVACSTDGRRIVVGAYGDEPLGSTGVAGGLVHIFDRQGDTFTRVGILSGSYASQSGDSFGYEVDCSGDGNVIVVGAKFDETGATASTGVVYVFDRSGNNFTEVGIITSSSNAATDVLGHSVSISEDGNTIVASAIGDNNGAVYVFDRTGINTFNEVGILTGGTYADDSSEFGTRVKISSNGKTIVVGCPNAEVDEAVDGTGLVHVFDRNPDNTFTRVGVLTGSHASQSSDNFGDLIDVSADGNTIAVGAYFDELTGGNAFDDDDGLGYIFTRQGDTFEEVSTFIWGKVPTLSADGKIVAFGDPDYESGGSGAGRVVIYEQQRQTYLHSTSTGNIGIGVTNPTAKLDVDGTLNVSGVSTLGTVKISSGIITATSGIVTYHGDGSQLSGIDATSLKDSNGVIRAQANTDGTISIGTHSIVSITTSHTASAGTPFTIDTFATSENDLAEYTIHVGYGTYIQAQKVLVMQDGTTAYSQEYAVMYNPSKIVTIESLISGSNVLLQATPETGISGITTYKIVRGGLV